MLTKLRFKAWAHLMKVSFLLLPEGPVKEVYIRELIPAANRALKEVRYS